MVSLIGNAVLEILKALIFRIAWKAVLERFLSRSVCFGLRKLAAMSTNPILTETAEDIIASLKSDKLPAMK